MSASPRYMLDTNIASFVIKNQPAVVKRILSVPPTSLCISPITQAELLYGVAKKPEAVNLPVIVREFLARIDIPPWDANVAEAYAALRPQCERAGKSLSAMDMLIAAHAMSLGTVLVTNDQAFYHLGIDLMLEDWTIPK
ncbi:MAG: type II toxin-antitoxin system VapC family toxin [Pseudomonadota bacterium]